MFESRRELVPTPVPATGDTVVVAQPGFALLRFKFDVSMKFSATTLVTISQSEGFRQPIVAWRVTKSGRAEPITLLDSAPIGADEVMGIFLPTGAVQALPSGKLFINEHAFITDIYEQFKAFKSRTMTAPEPEPVSVIIPQMQQVY